MFGEKVDKNYGEIDEYMREDVDEGSPIQTPPSSPVRATLNELAASRDEVKQLREAMQAKDEEIAELKRKKDEETAEAEKMKKTEEIAELKKAMTLKRKSVEEEAAGPATPLGRRKPLGISPTKIDYEAAQSIDIGGKKIELSRVQDPAKLCQLHQALLTDVSNAEAEEDAERVRKRTADADAALMRLDELAWEKSGKLISLSALTKQAGHRVKLVRGDLSPPAFEELGGDELLTAMWGVFRVSDHARRSDREWTTFLAHAKRVVMSDGRSFATEVFSRVRDVLLKTDTDQFRFVSACGFSVASATRAIPDMLKSDTSRTDATSRLYDGHGGGGAEREKVLALSPMDIFMGKLELADIISKSINNGERKVFSSETHKHRCAVSLSDMSWRFQLTRTVEKFNCPPCLFYDAFLVEVVRDIYNHEGAGPVVMPNGEVMMRRTFLSLLEEAGKNAECRSSAVEAKKDYDLLSGTLRGAAQDGTMRNWSVRLKTAFGFGNPPPPKKEKNAGGPGGRQVTGGQPDHLKGGKGGSKGVTRKEGKGSGGSAARSLVVGISDDAARKLEQEGFFYHSSHPDNREATFKIQDALVAAGLSKKSFTCPWWKAGKCSWGAACGRAHAVKDRFVYNKCFSLEENLERLKALIAAGNLSTENETPERTFIELLEQRKKEVV